MTYIGMVSNGRCFLSFGGLLPQDGRESSLALTRFLLEMLWLGERVTTMQKHYNESRGCPEAEVEEEKSVFCTCGS